MNSFTIILLVTMVLYESALVDAQCQKCELGGFYSQANGYECNVIDANTARCFCPGRLRFVDNGPCRPCAASNNYPPLCNSTNPQLLMCIETSDYDTGYACLCQNGGDPYATLNYNCEPSPTLTTRPTTTTTTAIGGPGGACANGGALVNGICQCPSGYGGQFCQTPTPSTSCQNVICKNNGVCAIQTPNGQYTGVCLCRYGTWGEYCELNGTLGYCSPGSCLNGAACQEGIVGSTRHAYCRCPPGYNGVKCENRYFSCPAPGNFYDIEMYLQGKYFSCTANPNGTFRLEQRSCGKGLRFNPGTNQCGY